MIASVGISRPNHEISRANGADIAARTGADEVVRHNNNSILSIVMAGLVPAIHAFLCSQDVDARHKAGHDVERINYKSNTNLAGSSRHSFTRTRKVTASRPSTMRWS